MRFIFLPILLILVFAPMMAYACLGPMSHSQVFLNNVPDNILESDIIAKVVILSTQGDGYERTSEVKVIDAIQNVEIDDIIQVISPAHSCAQDYDVQEGEEYYIAGELDDENLFTQEWQGDTRFNPFFKKINVGD